MQVLDKDVIISKSEKITEESKQGWDDREVWGYGILKHCLQKYGESNILSALPQTKVISPCNINYKVGPRMA